MFLGAWTTINVRAFYVLKNLIFGPKNFTNYNLSNYSYQGSMDFPELKKYRIFLINKCKSLLNYII
jgi:hypothetical protein